MGKNVIVKIHNPNKYFPITSLLDHIMANCCSKGYVCTVWEPIEMDNDTDGILIYITITRKMVFCIIPYLHQLISHFDPQEWHECI